MWLFARLPTLSLSILGSTFYSQAVQPYLNKNAWS